MVKKLLILSVIAISTAIILAFALTNRTQEAVWYISDDYVLDPASDTVTILVREVGCTSGEGAAGNTTKPKVSLTSTDVVIKVRTQVSRDAANCTGAPLAPIKVALGEPLGTRRLIDGNTAADNDSRPPESLFEGIQVPPVAASAAD